MLVAATAACSALLVAMVSGLQAQAAPAFDLVRVGPVHSEPGIDVGADGVVFVNAVRGVPSRSPLWRSTDGGLTYETRAFDSPYHRFPGGGDSDVAVGLDGRVYHLDLWVGSNSIVMSRDNGETWTSGGVFSTLPLTDRAWLTTAGPGSQPGTDRLYASYQLIQPPSNVVVARSDDGGATWIHHSLPHLPHQNTQPGQVVADGDFVAVSYHSGSQLWVARSNDGGLTWQQTRVDLFGDVRGGVFPAAGLSMSGDTIAASWQSTLGHQIYVAVSHDRGATWGLPVLVSDGTSSSVFPWVAVQGETVAVAWYGADRGGDSATMDASARWFVRYAESVDGGDTFGPAADVTDTIKFGQVCLVGLACTGGREFGDFLQLAITPGGRTMIAYVDTVNDATVPGVYVAGQTLASL